jgi:signal transduction histidine kinase
MGRLPSLSLFSRLYLTIAIAMIFSGTISIFVINQIHVQGAIDDYVAFTDNIYAGLLKEKKIVPNTPLKDLNETVHKVEGHLISWKMLLRKEPPCEVCEYVAHSGEVDVFRNTANQWFAVYKLPDINAWLVIFETNIFNFAELEKHEDKGFFSELSFHDIEDVTQLMIIFITIAIAIYWPVSIIKRQIENLIRIQHQFGSGDLSVRANDPFTKPIDELASSFNSMASAISDMVNENQVFAQAVPHEVRTPLSRIQLAVGLLSQNNNNEKQMALLGNIETYIDDINELISQVVDFSKLNSIKDDDGVSLYQEIKLDAFIESRIQVTKCEENREVIRQINAPLNLTTNPAYLRLLVDNLLKNAAIHSKSKIIISLNSFEDYTELSVEDDGDGIPKEYFDMIFIPFSRIDVSRSRKTGGLGLGLAIAKAACNRMNGQLTVENNLTSGAKFTCRFFNNI